jgi:hypothetical protein
MVIHRGLVIRGRRMAPTSTMMGWQGSILEHPFHVSRPTVRVNYRSAVTGSDVSIDPRMPLDERERANTYGFDQHGIEERGVICLKECPRDRFFRKTDEVDPAHRETREHIQTRQLSLDISDVEGEGGHQRS